MYAGIRIAAVDQMTSDALTRSTIDNAKAVLFWPLEPELILEKRRRWLDWLTVTQRKWQGETRRPSRARHHDSIAIREKYVRATAS